MLIEKFAHFHRDLVAQSQVVLHLWATQVEYAMCQTCGFGQVVVIQLERWRDRRIKYFQLMTQHFDLAGSEVGVVGTFRTCTYQTRDAQTKFVTHGLGRFEHVGAIRIADDLYETFAIAQVDEDDPAVVAAAVYPAAQADGLAHQCLVGQAAIVCSH